MIKSPLTNSVIEANSSNYSSGRSGYKVCKITPHHMAGVLSGEQCARLFQSYGRQASANYCIGYDGDIVLSVGEENRAWTSANKVNDCQAITIEVSNSSTGGDWPISERSWNSLVNLCVDICKRYGFRLNYTGNKDGSLTRHNMFTNTTCPGPYLQGRFSELADIVNKKLDGGDTPTPTPIKDISYIQSTLNERYGFGIKVDNIYGNETHTALIKALQIELNNQFGAGLVVDGIFGNQTKNACVNVRYGAQGNITWLIQAMLVIWGCEIDIDGIFRR